jgi:hypothetical protein
LPTRRHWFFWGKIKSDTFWTALVNGSYSKFICSWLPIHTNITLSQNVILGNLTKLGCHLLQNSFLENVYSDIIIFSKLQKHHGSNFLSGCQVLLVIPFAPQTERHPFSFIFNLENKAKSQGPSLASREDVE